MTDREAMYESILVDPWDNVPKLVYADYMEESGRPNFAAFIRLQCETEPMRKVYAYKYD